MYKYGSTAVKTRESGDARVRLRAVVTHVIIIVIIIIFFFIPYIDRSYVHISKQRW